MLLCLRRDLVVGSCWVVGEVGRTRWRKRWSWLVVVVGAVLGAVIKCSFSDVISRACYPQRRDYRGKQGKQGAREQRVWSGRTGHQNHTGEEGLEKAAITMLLSQLNVSLLSFQNTKQP